MLCKSGSQFLWWISYWDNASRIHVHIIDFWTLASQCSAIEFIRCLTKHGNIDVQLGQDFCQWHWCVAGNRQPVVKSSRFCSPQPHSLWTELRAYIITSRWAWRVLISPFENEKRYVSASLRVLLVSCASLKMLNMPVTERNWPG